MSDYNEPAVEDCVSIVWKSELTFNLAEKHTAKTKYRKVTQR